MSIFSRFRKSIKADKREKKEKRPSTSKKRETLGAPKPKYHHVPTHAAVDALNTAPQSWRQSDNAKVREINQRKSQLLMLRRNSSMAELLLNMPQAQGSGSGSATAYTPTAMSQWRTETPAGRNTAFVPLKLDLNVSPVRSDSSEASSVPSLRSDTTSHASSYFTPIASVASTFDFAYRCSKRPHPRPKIFAHNDVFTHLQSRTRRKLGETLPHDELFNVSPDKAETSSEYDLMNYYRQTALAAWALPVLKEGPRHSVMKWPGGQRPPSVGIETILE